MYMYACFQSTNTMQLITPDVLLSKDEYFEKLGVGDGDYVSNKQNN